MKRAHKDLRVWQCAIELVEAVYRLTSTFPRKELFGLSSQMRRAAVSVPSNIAEGSARQSTKELLYFLSIAAGSLAELDTQLEVASRLGIGQIPASLQDKLDETSALLQASRKTLSGKAG